MARAAAGNMPRTMTEYNVYPDIWDRPQEQELNFEYIWHWYVGLVEFYRQAAERGEAILLHLG